MIQIKRVYDPAAPSDGRRVLVERLWPRGMKKEALRMDGWMKEAAPSTLLRRWFNHEPAKWEEFQRRYREELKGNPEVLEKLDALASEASEASEAKEVREAGKGNLTLLFSSHDLEHNNALALKRFLEER